MMKITIHGHTLPVRDVEHADRLIAREDEFLVDDDTDGLEKWLYAGAPLEGEGGAE